MKRRVFAVLLSCVMLLLVLGACSSSNTPANNGTSNSGSSATDAPDTGATDADTPDAGTSDTDAPAESGTLTLWTWKVAMTPGFREAAAVFKERTGFDVEVEAFTPDDTYRQKVIAAANSGDLPDLMHWWATRGYGFENVPMQMNDHATDEYRSKFAASAFNDCLVRQTDVDNWANDAEKSDVEKSLKAGDLYQIPLDVGGFFTIYANNDILSQVGLENKVPKNYDEFIEFAAKVGNETDYGGFVFAGALPDVYYNWMGRAVENTYLGAQTSVDIINRRATMSEGRNIDPLKKFEQLCRSGGLLDGMIAMDIDQGDQAFAAGQAAYLLGGTFTYGQLQAMGMDVDNQVFSFVVPMMDGSTVTQPYAITPFTLTAMMVSKDSPNADKALEYIDFISTDPEGVPIFANNAYIIPAAALTDETISKLSPAIQDMYNSLTDEINVTSEVDNWEGSIGKKLEYDELYKDMQKIIIGEMTAEQAAANFDANAAAQAAAGQ